MYQVRQVMPSGRFYVCVNSDEDFIESYQPEALTLTLTPTLTLNPQP